MTALSILERIDALTNKASFVEGKRATVAKNLKDIENNVATLEANITKLEKVQKVLSALVDKLVKKDLGMITT
jgi:phage shock protein A